MQNTILTHPDWSKKLIKGKVTELIFEQMFRKVGHFTVIPFGYESTQPELMQYAHKAKYPEVLDIIRSSPDFVLVSHNKEEVFLVEVKYHNIFNLDQIMEEAKKVQERWRLVRIFVATPKGFYFDSCKNILEQRQISVLKSEWIDNQTQTEYLSLLNQFIQPTSTPSN